MSDCLIGVHLTREDWEAIAKAAGEFETTLSDAYAERILAEIHAALERAQAAGVA